MSRCFISNPVLKEPTKFTLAPILSQIGMIFVSSIIFRASVDSVWQDQEYPLLFFCNDVQM